MKPWQHRLRHSVIELAVLITLHAILIRVLAERNVVATIFAAGGDVPHHLIVLAVFFILIRLLVVLALPGMILTRLAMIIWDAVCPPPPKPAERP